MYDELRAPNLIENGKLYLIKIPWHDLTPQAH